MNSSSDTGIRRSKPAPCRLRRRLNLLGLLALRRLHIAVVDVVLLVQLFSSSFQRRPFGPFEASRHSYYALSTVPKVDHKLGEAYGAAHAGFQAGSIRHEGADALVMEDLTVFSHGTWRPSDVAAARLKRNPMRTKPSGISHCQTTALYLPGHDSFHLLSILHNIILPLQHLID